MRQKCTHNPLKDIQKVVPGCAPDLNAAIKTGMIPDTGVESVSNGLEELSDIGRRVREPFDVIHFDRAYAKIKSKAEENDKK